ncbi:MAG: lysophospholipid acyltransferase family protein [bacterium]
MFRYLIGILFLIFYLFWGLLCYPIYLLSGKKVGKSIVQTLFTVTLKICGVKTVVEGLENVDENEKYLVISNHQSVFDIPVIGAALPLNLRIFAKKELLKIPLFGQLLLMYDFVFVDRNNPRQAVKDLKKASEKMELFSFLVFPEGTRSKDGKVGKFKSGTFSLAIEANKAILPVALRGVSKIMEPGKFIVNKGTVYMKVFPPVKIKEGDSRKDIAEKLQLIIAEYCHLKGENHEKN